MRRTQRACSRRLNLFLQLFVVAAVVSLSASASVAASTSDDAAAVAAVAVMSRFAPSKLWAIIVNLQCTYKMPST